ncbi:MAG TPA: ChaN family lipoprotein [Gammaproteobacteria bacterium]
MPPPAPDPLEGRIFAAADGSELDQQALRERMLAADVVYLGEIHDNPHHHAIQEQLLDGLVAAGASPALALEAVGSEQTGYLMDYATGAKPGPMAHAGPVSSRHLRARLDWGDEEDRRWQRYGGLLERARQARLPAFGIDLPPAQRLRLQRVGRSGLAPLESAQLPPHAEEAPAFAGLVREQLAGAHCGFGTPESIGRLYDTWVARNDAMAAAVVAALDDPDHRPVLVVVGLAHTAHGQGVLRRVAELRPGTRQLNLGLYPVAAEPQPLQAYLAAVEVAGSDLGPEHELVWITPRQERDDPCAPYRELLRQRLGEADKQPAEEGQEGERPAEGEQGARPAQGKE